MCAAACHTVCAVEYCVCRGTLHVPLVVGRGDSWDDRWDNRGAAADVYRPTGIAPLQITYQPTGIAHRPLEDEGQWRWMMAAAAGGPGDVAAD